MSLARAASVVALVVAAHAPSLSDGCARAVGKRKEAEPSASVVPLPAPAASATTPPVWAPPEAPASAPAAPPNPDLLKARALAQAGDYKKVRALLEKKVKSGKASKEEASLLADACMALKDKACVEAAKAKRPEIDGI